MRVLFVVTAFYPEQAIGSVRTTKFAKYFARSGIEVSVISLTPAPWAMHDEALHFPELDNMQWVQIDQSPLFNRFFQKARNAAVGNATAVGFVRPSGSQKSLKASIMSIAQLGYTMMKSIDWAWQVKKYARQNMKNERFDAIYCSYPSFASPAAAHALSRIGLSKRVLIDFRDPVSYGSNNRFGLLRFLERRMLKHAQAASFVSQGVRSKVLAESYPDKMSLVVTNGFDPEDAKTVNASSRVESQPNVLRFAYVGALYGGKRNLSSFFRAARQALDASGFKATALELHYAGGESELFVRQAAEHGLEENVVNHGRVSRQESLGVQKSIDICLVTTWNSSEDKGILTGKVFEFFMLRKPVLAIVNGPLPGSELGAIIRQVGAGFCYEDATPNEFPLLVQWIARALHSKVEDGVLDNSYNDKVDEFGFPSLAVEIRQAFENTVFPKIKAH